MKLTGQCYILPQAGTIHLLPSRIHMELSAFIRCCNFFAAGNGKLFHPASALASDDADGTGQRLRCILFPQISASAATSLFSGDAVFSVGDGEVFKSDASLSKISCVFPVGDASPLKSDEAFFAENRVFRPKTIVFI